MFFPPLKAYRGITGFCHLGELSFSPPSRFWGEGAQLLTLSQLESIFTKLLGFSIGRDIGALKGVKSEQPPRQKRFASSLERALAHLFFLLQRDFFTTRRALLSRRRARSFFAEAGVPAGVPAQHAAKSTSSIGPPCRCPTFETAQRAQTNTERRTRLLGGVSRQPCPLCTNSTFFFHQRYPAVGVAVVG